MIKRSLGLLLVAVLLGAGLSTIAGAAPSTAESAGIAGSIEADHAFLVPQGSPTPSVSGSPAPSPTSTEKPPKKCPPKKGKGKKKKKGCPPQKPSGPRPCPTYTPGEAGAEAETSVVTDGATEEAPIEIEVSTDAGLGSFVATPDESSHVFHNIQVDSVAAETGLYVRFEFPTLRDYDLYLNDSSGVDVASATGFNPENAALGGSDGDAGGHSEGTSETLVGIKTPDCFGYTLDITGFMTEGGTRTLSLWLGEIQYTPGG